MDRQELKYLLITSSLLTLSFPPLPLGMLAPVGIALFMGFIKERSPQDSFRLGYWFGLFWGAMTLYWIATSNLLSAVLVIGIKGFQYALVWWLYALIKDRHHGLALLNLPFLWIGLEYLTQFTDLRFNWLTLAHTQTYYLPLLQIIEYTGYHFISWLVIVTAVSIYLLISTKSKSRLIPAGMVIGVLVLMISYGHRRIGKIDARSYSILSAGLVQPDVNPYLKWDPGFARPAFEMLMSESRRLISDQPDLIVWPETATPFYLRTHLTELNEIKVFIDSARVCLLTGTHDYQQERTAGERYYYNAAFFFNREEHGFQKYYKMALVPGSETVPFKTMLPFLSSLSLGGGDYFPGHHFTVFDFKIPSRYGFYQRSGYTIDHQSPTDSVKARLSAVICYESVFPDIVRRFVKKGANLIAIITNDGWFGNSSGPYQHFRYSVLRAIENRISIVRCANTGVSGYIDPAGRVLSSAGLNSRKNLTATIPLRDIATFYTRHGDFLGPAALIFSASFIFFILFSKRFVRSLSLKNL